MGSLNLKKLKKNDLKKYFIVQARLEKKLTGKGKVKNRILKRIKALTKAEIKILTKAKAKILSLVKAKDKILNNKIEIKKRKKKEEKAMPNQIKIKMAKKKKVDYINISFIKKFIKDKKSKKNLYFSKAKIFKKKFRLFNTKHLMLKKKLSENNYFINFKRRPFQKTYSRKKL